MASSSFPRVVLLSSHVAEVARLHAWVDALPTEFPPMQPLLSDIRLVLEECVVNAIRHGNAEDPSKQVHVEVREVPVGWEFVICDEGPGLDLSTPPDPTSPERLYREGGRGLLFIHHFADDVHYCPDRRGVCLTFHRPQ